MPILKFGTNTNYTIFKEKLSTACVEKYGHLGKLIELDEYWEPAAIVPSNYTNTDAAIQQVLTLELAEDVKERKRILAKMNNDKPNMYGYIFSKLSTESEQEVRRHTDYDIFSVEKYPKGLWNAITEKHLIISNTTSKPLLKLAAFRQYASVRQEPYE